MLAVLTLAAAALPDPLAARPSTHENNRLSISTPAPDLQHADLTQNADEMLQRPYVVNGAVITGLADADAQAELGAEELRRSSRDVQLRGDTGSSGGQVNSTWAQTASGGRRGLLHGRRSPWKYSGCPRCTLVRCSNVGARRVCSGHCKKARQLFSCSSQEQTRGVCNTPLDERPDPNTLVPDPIQPLDSVQVLAPAPYIGCANITGVPDGCPDSGTTGAFADGTPLSVFTSWCVQHRYSPDCDDELKPPGTPFHPFGFCQCMFVYEGKVALGPCETRYVDWEGPSTGDGEHPVSVSEEGSMTRTTFGVTEPPDFRIYYYSHTFTEKGEDIAVKLDLYTSFPERGENITLEGPLPGPAPADASSRRGYRSRE